MTCHKYNITNSTFINTSESYSDGLIIGNKNIVIPYINIGLMPDNPINGHQSVIDYCYYVFLDVRSLVINYATQKIQLHYNPRKTGVDLIEEYIMVGGINTQNGCEAKIVCNERAIYFKNSAKFSESSHPFMPFDTSVYKQNLNIDDVNSFLSFNDLPKEIDMVLGKHYYILT